MTYCTCACAYFLVKTRLKYCMQQNVDFVSYLFIYLFIDCVVLEYNIAVTTKFREDQRL